MPKIIENLECRLVEEVKRQLEESGYDAITIRSVASACGVGVGTVYNYFPSKEDLIAKHLLTDWKQCISAIQAAGAASDTPLPVVFCIYDQLLNFAHSHAAIFQDEAAAASFTSAFSHHHSVLRSQLAQSITKFCASAFTAEFILEALLTWTMAQKSFDEIYGIIEKLF